MLGAGEEEIGGAEFVSTPNLALGEQDGSATDWYKRCRMLPSFLEYLHIIHTYKQWESEPFHSQLSEP